jgi:hypothetical protein
VPSGSSEVGSAFTVMPYAKNAAEQTGQLFTESARWSNRSGHPSPPEPGARPDATGARKRLADGSSLIAVPKREAAASDLRSLAWTGDELGEAARAWRRGAALAR